MGDDIQTMIQSLFYPLRIRFWRQTHASTRLSTWLQQFPDHFNLVRPISIHHKFQWIGEVLYIVKEGSHYKGFHWYWWLVQLRNSLTMKFYKILPYWVLPTLILSVAKNLLVFSYKIFLIIARSMEVWQCSRPCLEEHIKLSVSAVMNIYGIWESSALKYTDNLFIFWTCGNPARAATPPGLAVGRCVGIGPTKTIPCTTLRLKREGSRICC